MNAAKEWATRIKVLIVTAVIASIGNMLATLRDPNPDAITVMPWVTLQAMGVMLVIIVIACFIQEFFEKKLKIKLPKILFISMLAILVSIPGFSPIAGWIQTSFKNIGVLPLCTPILAYAGISIGKDMEAFKKQGLGIVCVTLLAFIGTYIGSAIIAQILLKATNVIP